MQESENNGRTPVHAFQPKALAHGGWESAEGGLVMECETLRRQNTDLRKRLTAALDDSGASKKALHQSREFERIGRLAAGVAHDFSNFVTGILGVVSELSEELGPGSPHRAILEIAMNAAQKAGSLSKRLLTPGRRYASKQVLNLNQVIGEMSPILRRLLGPGIEFNVLLDESLGNIKADQSQMEQVILNLALNARDAMPAGGKLTMETSHVDSAAGLGRRPSIKLEVLDTGVGMDPQTLSHIFEPFFTTKEATKGTGLGLATLKGIVEEHDGNIAVVSEPQRGSRFTIVLPCVAI